MPCPRCQGASEPGARSCPRCGAPLSLREDPLPSCLDAAIDLDRRHSPRIAGSARWDPAAPGEEDGNAFADEEPPSLRRAARRGGSPALLVAARARALLVWRRLRRACQVPTAPPLEPAREGDGEHALRWRRAAAWAIDLSVLAVACAPPLVLAWGALPAGAGLLATLLPSAAAFAALLGFAYGALGHSLMGATFGKRLLGLQVVGPDGGFPGFGRSAARSGLAVLGTAGLGVGVLMALFTPSRRGLHDLLADTVVIRAPRPCTSTPQLDPLSGDA